MAKQKNRRILGAFERESNVLVAVIWSDDPELASWRAGCAEAFLIERRITTDCLMYEFHEMVLRAINKRGTYETVRGH